ncbi:hypothetical protein CCP2SC5_100021 [Azospirillaceae bacterium]
MQDIQEHPINRSTMIESRSFYRQRYFLDFHAFLSPRWIVRLFVFLWFMAVQAKFRRLFQKQSKIKKNKKCIF